MGNLQDSIYHTLSNRKYDRIIMNNPTKSLDYVQLLVPFLKTGGTMHLYCILPKDQSIDVMSFFGSGFECTLMREVHPYSPTTSMMVFDVKKS